MSLNIFKTCHGTWVPDATQNDPQELLRMGQTKCSLPSHPSMVYIINLNWHWRHHYYPYIYISLSLECIYECIIYPYVCVCVLCSYSVVETKNHTRMRCLKIGHPKIPRLIIVSEYSKWPEIGERPHFWAPISPLYCIPSPLNPYCCWSFLVASPSNIPIVKRHSYWLLVLKISHISGHWILHISGRSLVRHVSFVDCPGHATRSTRSRSRWIWLILILTFKVCKDKNINTYCEAYHIHTIMCTHTYCIYICTVHVWGQNTYICVRFFPESILISSWLTHLAQDILMATMLNGAAVMDAALLVIAGRRYRESSKWGFPWMGVPSGNLT